MQESDQRHVAPGAETIRELFGGEPTLIMIDEVSVYLGRSKPGVPGCQSASSRHSSTPCSRPSRLRRTSLSCSPWPFAMTLKPRTLPG